MTVLETEDHGVLVPAGDELVELVESRRRQEYFVTLINVLAIAEVAGVDAQPNSVNSYS